MSQKSFRFDEEDDQMFADALFLLKRKCKTDIDVIRHCLDYFLSEADHSSLKEDKEKLAKKKKREDFIESEYKRLTEEMWFCPCHDVQAVNCPDKDNGGLKKKIGEMFDEGYQRV